MTKRERSQKVRDIHARNVQEIAHRLVHGAMEARDQEKSITGEWIIFDTDNGSNKYLCLARHNDRDEAIFAKLKSLVFTEFPYLNDKYN